MTSAASTRAMDPVQVRRAMEILKEAGNPFRNHFARNSDDESCGRIHVPDLYQRERTMLLALVDQFREKPGEDASLLPVLGNKGTGKTHLLHSIKHGISGRQVLVTPGTYQRDTDFLEYLLFQVIDTLLGGSRQGKSRPIHMIGLDVACRSLAAALVHLPDAERIQLFPPPIFGKFLGKLGLGHDQAREKCSWLVSRLEKASNISSPDDLIAVCHEVGLAPSLACTLASTHASNTMGRSTQGIMVASVVKGYCQAIFHGDESDLSSFLTYGFAEIAFHVRPSRADLVLALFRAVMEIAKKAKVPIIIAFDQLEDLLLARRGEDSFRVAESFFAGIVQALHQIPGLGFLLFAERGLWNRFIPSLDGYMRDRLTNPVHLPGMGTLQSIRLDPPHPTLVRMVVEARLKTIHSSHPCFSSLPPVFPLEATQVERVAKTESTLRDMLQQYRAIFDSVVYGAPEPEIPVSIDLKPQESPISVNRLQNHFESQEDSPDSNKGYLLKSVVEISVNSAPSSNIEPAKNNPRLEANLADIWEIELASAKRQLSPEGSLCGATREIHNGLGFLLRLANEHGIRVGPWRLQHVVESFDFGDHPVYGVVSLGHWSSQSGTPWKVGVGLFLGKGQGKFKDLSVKLSCLDFDPPLIDHLILLRSEDDLVLSGKSRQVWQETERRGKHARIESMTLDTFSLLYALPRIHSTAIENHQPEEVRQYLSAMIQEKAESIMRQVCMPAQDI